jgi:hypothetical protein
MPETRSNVCLKHGNQVCSKCVVVTDAAKRMCDAINLHLVCQPWEALVGSWLAFALTDGSSKGEVYDTYQDAVRHNDPKRYAIFAFRNAMGGANARDCQLFLEMHRAATDAGIDWAEPKQNRSSLIIPTRGHDILTRRILP